MAQAWLKKYLRMKPEVNQIFDDLEEYRNFCRDHGFVFDEAHLYVERSPWGDMRRSKASGRPARDNWYGRSERRDNREHGHKKYRVRVDG